MAIEFNCPFCTATIRVPDAYSGQQGRCPKCNQKLLIPNISTPQANQLSGEGPPQQHGKSGSMSTSAGAPTPDGPETDDSVSAAAIAVRPTTSSIARAHRRSARLRPSRALVIGIPIICFLVLFGTIAYSLLNSLPRLQGELTGHRLEGKPLPGATIPWADVNVGPADQVLLQEALHAHPETLVSQTIVCQLSADDKGIVVTLNAQPECLWVAVEIGGDKPLAIWRRKEGPLWNQMRLSELRAAVQRYAKDKLLKINGERVAIDPAATRDQIALNAGCGSLGYVIKAVADAASFPCAAEDEFGTLYFCLPRVAHSFKIQGRTLANGMSGFNGEYTVTIESDVTAASPVPPVSPVPTGTEVQTDPSALHAVPGTSETEPVTSRTNSQVKD